MPVPVAPPRPGSRADGAEYRAAPLPTSLDFAVRSRSVAPFPSLVSPFFTVFRARKLHLRLGLATSQLFRASHATAHPVPIPPSIPTTRGEAVVPAAPARSPHGTGSRARSARSKGPPRANGAFRRREMALMFAPRARSRLFCLFFLSLSPPLSLPRSLPLPAFLQPSACSNSRPRSSAGSRCTSHG